MEIEVSLSRQRMVVRALLFGCGYNLGGVAGVGLPAVTRLFSVWAELELQRVLAWAEDSLEREAGSLVNSSPCTAGCVDTRVAWRVTDGRVRDINIY